GGRHALVVEDHAGGQQLKNRDQRQQRGIFDEDGGLPQQGWDGIDKSLWKNHVAQALEGRHAHGHGAFYLAAWHGLKDDPQEFSHGGGGVQDKREYAEPEFIPA